ncbi:MAG: FtsX-like permease family protein [Pseudomonadota bacterium]
MEIRPILSTLLRNRVGATLIALQIALTMAVIINSVFIILDRAETMRKPIGIAPEHLVTVSVADVADDADLASVVSQDKLRLAELDGVIGATKMSTMPLSNSGSNSSYRNGPDENDATYTSIAYYQAGFDAIDVLGLSLTRGRWFTADEIRYDPPDGETPKVAVISDAAANALYGDEDPIGQYFYTGTNDAIEVIGTIEMMSRPWYNWGDFYVTMLVPVVQRHNQWVVRVDPARRESLLEPIADSLREASLDRLVGTPRAYDEIIARTYQRDVAMNRMLTVVMMLVVAITALGIVGLASFSVMQRRRQVGTRRAIGARRFHILRYFLVENWLITTGGIVLGLALSFGINHLLVTEYEMPKLDPVYLPSVVLGLWVLGLLAALGPARNAMGVDPAIATRNI